MAFSLPRWNSGNPLVDDRGRPTELWHTFDSDRAKILEDQEQRQDEIDTDLQAAVATLEVTVDAVEALAGSTATLAGQVSAFTTFYEPIINSNTSRITTIENRLAAAGIP